MKKFLLTVSLVLITSLSYAQVGINTTNPNAQLDIKSSNQATPANNDGILIPKIDAFPVTNPTAAQNSMMVYLTTTSAGKLPGFYYWDNPSTSWKGVGANTANAWGLSGNAGTDSTINFIGTTDISSLRFKVQNLPAGILDNSQRLTTYFGVMAGASDTGYDNVGVGFGALKLNIIGNGNTAVGSEALSKNLNNFNSAVGYKAMENNTIGVSNVAFGSGSLRYNKAGSNAVAIGNEAMQYANNTTTPFDNKNVAVGYQSQMGSTTPASNTGNYNTAVGYQTLANITYGSNNTAVGSNALNLNTGGYGNSAFGQSALSRNTGSSNTAMGTRALLLNTSGDSNTANGNEALYNNDTGSNNVAIGNGALHENNAGSNAVAIGKGAMIYSNDTATPFENKNIAIGFESLKGSITAANNTGNGNVAIGYQSLLTNTSGDNNVSIGKENMISNTTGFENVVIGTEALSQNTWGYQNVAIGFRSLMSAVATGNTALGSNSMVNTTDGYDNLAIGVTTLYNNTNGYSNTAIGGNALYNNSTGFNNTAIGNFAGSAITNGSHNIAIGSNADVLAPTGSNQLSIANVIYGSNMNNLATAPANISIGATPNVNYRFYSYTNQLTANGDGQYGIYSYRTRDSQNNGTSYALGYTNAANAGYNYFGDLYTFGTIGYCYNDYNRTGGVLGSYVNGTYWSSLGYKNSASTAYGVYATAALATGTGRISHPETEFSIGGGFYGGLIGSWSRGNLIGNINSGKLLASYNNGDEYTSGKQIELVTTGTSKTAVYTVTSTESVVYKKGKITLSNGVARVSFDENYKNLLGEIPVVTTSPMGQCNGIYIESVDKNGFTIKELNNGTSNISVSWIAVGERIDANTTTIPASVLAKDFDANLNDVMFNENNLNDSAKAMWSNGITINFGKLPENLIDKPVKTEEKNNN